MTTGAPIQKVDGECALLADDESLGIGNVSDEFRTQQVLV